MPTTIEILKNAWPGYALIDSGDRRKLERFGETVVVREEPKAWWPPALDKGEWAKAAAEHDEKSGLWKLRGKPAKAWKVDFHGVQMEARITDGSKHLGLFPEQSPHWEYLRANCGRGKAESVLNLFGYTGAASLVAAQAGAAVTHCDASKPAIAWGRHNQELSGLADKPVRWMLDDAVKFAQREIRRNRRYDAVLLDPPSFGRGPRKELWKVEDQIMELLDLCKQLLSDDARFLILTMYNLEASSLMLHNLLGAVLGNRKGAVSIGELALPHENGDRLLPLSLFGRWERE